MWTERPVMEEIAIRLELSLEVAILATLIAILLAIPLGTTAALYRDTWIDYLMRIVTIGGISIPVVLVRHVDHVEFAGGLQLAAADHLYADL